MRVRRRLLRLVRASSDRGAVEPSISLSLLSSRPSLRRLVDDEGDFRDRLYVRRGVSEVALGRFRVPEAARGDRGMMFSVVTSSLILLRRGGFSKG